MQNLLLALGVGLLGVAAVIFVAVSWDRLGVGGRSAVLAGVTGLAGLAAVRTQRRGLLSTAESLSLLTVGLAVLDCHGARSAGLAGLDTVDGEAYWSGALAVVAILVGLFAAILPTRSLPPAAALLGQLSVPLLAVHLASRVGHESAFVAALFTGQVVVTGALLATWTGPRSRAARVVLLAGGSLVFAVAALTSFVAAYREPGSTVIGVGLLLLLAAVAAVPGTWPGRRPVARDLVVVLDALAAALVVAAVWAPAYHLAADRWLPPVLAVLGTALVALVGLVPAARRLPCLGVALVAAVAPAVAAVDAFSDTVEGMLRPLEAPWTESADSVVVVADRPAAVVLVIAAVTLVLVSRVGRTVVPAPAGRIRVAETFEVLAVVVLAAAGLLAAPAAGSAYPAAVGSLVALAAVALIGGALAEAQFPAPARGALGCGLAVLGLAVSWSFAVDVATLAVLPAAAGALLAGAVAARGAAVLRPWRVALVVLAAVLLDAEAGAVARYDGAGWPAVWSVALALLAAAGLAATLTVALRTGVADTFWAPLHTAAVVVASAAAVADVAAVAAWRGAGVAGSGLAAAGAVAVLLAATAAPWPTARPVRGTVQLVGAVTAGPALAAAAVDGDQLWVALLVLGVGIALVATTPDRHDLGWLAGLVLAGSSWVRLALADVDAPEAYTVPGGVTLLVVGALRRRRDPSYSSWKAYGAGLSLALVPSLLRAVTDAGELRPLLLALAAAGVVAAGVARRLQAPLLLGAAVLAADAIVQLAPYLATAYDAVPRWVTIGLLGLALLGTGATYERRVRDLRRVGRGVARLG